MKNSASTMKELALTLFGIKDTSTYKMDCPFEEDPRGYVEVIGDDPFTPFSFKRDGKEIQYRNLTLFSDHISFIAGEQEVVLMPDDESVVIYTVDSAADALISVDLVLGIALGNSANRTCACACAAGNAAVTNYVCHK